MRTLTDKERRSILEEIITLSEPVPTKDDDEVTVQQFIEAMKEQDTTMSISQARSTLQRAEARGKLTSRKVQHSGHIRVAFRKAEGG